MVEKLLSVCKVVVGTLLSGFEDCATAAAAIDAGGRGAGALDENTLFYFNHKQEGFC